MLSSCDDVSFISVFLSISGIRITAGTPDIRQYASPVLTMLAAGTLESLYDETMFTSSTSPISGIRITVGTPDIRQFASHVLNMLAADTLGSFCDEISLYHSHR